MTVWESARVLALAADPSAARAGRALSTPASWVSTGSAADYVWGRCQGSGRTPYQTVVHVGERPAFRCSCPSRGFPCKHALGLLLLWSSGQVEPSDPDSFAAEWMARCSARPSAEPATSAGGIVVDPEAATRRAAARRDRVSSGLEELDRWLRDQVRSGLAGLDRAGYGFFEQLAARMVDAQAPGVASMVRSIPAELAREDWPARVLEALAGLRLLVKAHRQLDRLPPELAATVRSRVGYPVAKEAVLAGPAVTDHWTALGSVDTVEYRLETRRVWLWGSRTRRWALWLAFAPPGQSLDATVTAGRSYLGALHFYPGSGQLRALPGPYELAEDLRPAPASNLSQAAGQFAAQVAADPWADRMPVVLAGQPVEPARAGQPWRLRDATGAGCELVGVQEEPWALLAHAAAGPVSLFGEWSSSGLRPISIVPDTLGRPLTAELLR